jgi:hypothetical protein
MESKKTRGFTRGESIKTRLRRKKEKKKFFLTDGLTSPRERLRTRDLSKKELWSKTRKSRGFAKCRSFIQLIVHVGN